MTGKIKCLIASAVAGLFVTGNAAYAAKSVAETLEDDVMNEQGFYTFTADGATVKVNTENLNLEIEKDGRVWYSGKRYTDGDDDLGATWVSKLEDAVTVGYRNIELNTPTESAIGRLRSTVKLTEKSNGFDAKINCKSISLTFTLEVRIVDGNLQTKIPYDSIEEKSEKYRLAYLIVYPFFDSSYGTQNGEIIVPDGSGASIDLSATTTAKQSYTARVYGEDLGISQSSVGVNTPETASMPLFAITYDDGGTLVTADSGAEYCTIKAYASGVENINYNFAYMQWIYRETYVKYYESTGSDGKSYITFQENMNKFDAVQTMTLLGGGCDVADVAKAYRERFTFKDNTAHSDAGLRLEFLMAENKQGLFGKEVVKMTDADYVAQTVKEVGKYCNNLSVAVTGYSKGGLNGSSPDHFPLESKTGSSRDYKNLSADLKAMGGSLSFVADYVKAYEDAVGDKKLALNISNQFITVKDIRQGSKLKFNLLKAGEVHNLLQDEIKSVKKYNAGLDLESIGYLLYSGYKSDGFSRTDAIKALNKAVKESGVKSNIFKPNSYMWEVCDGSLNTPVTASGFMIETRSVPLLQLTLSGKIPMYSSAINLNYTGEEQILRLIDYNVYPSFTLTEKDAIELYGTSSSNIFTSSYDVWGETVKKVYEKVNAVLSKVSGQTAEARYSPADGVWVTAYSNGVSVVVNYTSAEVDVSGNKIPALSAAALTL